MSRKTRVSGLNTTPSSRRAATTTSSFLRSLETANESSSAVRKQIHARASPGPDDGSTKSPIGAPKTPVGNPKTPAHTPSPVATPQPLAITPSPVAASSPVDTPKVLVVTPSPVAAPSNGYVDAAVQVSGTVYTPATPSAPSVASANDSADDAALPSQEVDATVLSAAHALIALSRSGMTSTGSNGMDAKDPQGPAISSSPPQVDDSILTNNESTLGVQDETAITLPSSSAQSSGSQKSSRPFKPVLLPSYTNKRIGVDFTQQGPHSSAYDPESPSPDGAASFVFPTSGPSQSPPSKGNKRSASDAELPDEQTEDGSDSSIDIEARPKKQVLRLTWREKDMAKLQAQVQQLTKKNRKLERQLVKQSSQHAGVIEPSLTKVAGSRRVTGSRKVVDSRKRVRRNEPERPLENGHHDSVSSAGAADEDVVMTDVDEQQDRVEGSPVGRNPGDQDMHKDAAAEFADDAADEDEDNVEGSPAGRNPGDQNEHIDAADLNDDAANDSEDEPAEETKDVLVQSTNIQLLKQKMKDSDRIVDPVKDQDLIARSKMAGSEIYDDDSANDMPGPPPKVGKKCAHLFRNVKWGDAAYIKEDADGFEENATKYTRFVPGRWERMPDGTLRDQKEKLVVRIVDQKGHNKVHLNAPPKDWTNQTAISSLNKRCIQQVRRNTNLRMREVVTPYIHAERTWIRDNIGGNGKPKKEWPRLVLDFNETFAGKIVPGSSTPRPARTHSSLSKEVDRFKADYSNGRVPIIVPKAKKGGVVMDARDIPIPSIEGVVPEPSMPPRKRAAPMDEEEDGDSPRASKKLKLILRLPASPKRK